MPVLNEAERLATALARLARSGAPVVVVDGGSTDRSVAVALHEGVRVLSSPRGRARQMNAGAAECVDASVLLFVHADVELPPDWREAIERAVASGASWGRFDVALMSARPMLRLVSAMMNLRSRITGIATGDQAIFLTKEAWMQTGGWPDVPLMEDIRMSRRLLRQVGRPACLRSTVRVSARRWEGRGIGRTITLMWVLRLMHAIGTSPATLHRWYYGRPPVAAQSSSPGRIIVFAKVPRAGEVKTRLAAVLGAEGALAAYRQLLEHTLAQTAAVPGVARELCVAGHDVDGECEVLARQYGFELSVQSGDDLGDRMMNALRPGLGRGERVVLIGSDCPVLRAVDLADALDALKGTDHAEAVFAPTEDGGYVLVGAVGAMPPVFESMHWSHAQVMAQTRKRLDAAGIRYRMLRTLWDVDELADWERWQALRTPSHT